MLGAWITSWESLGKNSRTFRLMLRFRGRLDLMCFTYHVNYVLSFFPCFSSFSSSCGLLSKYSRNDNPRCPQRENCIVHIVEWEVNPESAKTPSISLPLTHGNPHPPTPPAQPFSIISAQTSLLKRVKLKPQFWKLQNSFINAQPSLQLIGFRPEVRSCTQTCMRSHLQCVCTQLLQLSDARTTNAFGTTANTERLMVVAAPPSRRIFFHGSTRSTAAPQKLAWPLHESKRGNKTSFCVLGVSSNLTRSALLKSFSARKLFYRAKVPRHARFKFNQRKKKGDFSSSTCCNPDNSFTCLKKQTKWNRYEDRNSIMLSWVAAAAVWFPWSERFGALLLPNSLQPSL